MTMHERRILHLLNTLEDASNNRLVLDLIRELGGQGYAFHVGYVTEAGVLEQELSEAGARVADLTLGTHGRALPRRLRDYVREQGIGAIHTHILRADWLGWLATRQNRSCRLIATKHNLGYGPGQARRSVRNALFYASMYLPDLVIVVSDLVRERLLALPGLAPERVVTVHNGIRAERFDGAIGRQRVRAEWGLDDATPLIGYVGRLVAGKGIEHLIRALADVRAQVPGTVLTVVGAGPLAESLRALATERGLGDAVRLAGYRTDVPAVLAALDVYALPSLTEGFPLGVLEAMAAGKPIVATRVGGIPEQVRHEVEGLLIPPGDEQALASALIRTLCDRSLGREMGARARTVVAEKFSVPTMAQKYDRAYRDLWSLATHRQDVYTSRTHTCDNDE
jgi:glycosyltransferase involved in cell wall biosynthesis